MDEALEVVEAVETVEETDEADEAIEVDVETTEVEKPDINGMIEALKGEVSSLREELGRRDGIYERAATELSEFIRLYPGVALDDIPQSAWEMARGGVPLAAAYAYGEVVRRRHEAEIAEADRKARESSSGSLSGGGEDFYSPDEVRLMSPDEVRANYKKITESMKKWH